MVENVCVMICTNGYAITVLEFIDEIRNAKEYFKIYLIPLHTLTNGYVVIR